MLQALYVEMNFGPGDLRYFPAEGHKPCADRTDAQQFHTDRAADLVARLAEVTHGCRAYPITLPVLGLGINVPAAPVPLALKAA